MGQTPVELRAVVVESDRGRFVARTDEGVLVSFFANACRERLALGVRVVLRHVRERAGKLDALRVEIDDAHRAEYEAILARKQAEALAVLEDPEAGVELERRGDSIVGARVRAFEAAPLLVALGAFPRLERLAVDHPDHEAMSALQKLELEALVSAKIGCDPDVELERGGVWLFAARCPALAELEIDGRLRGPIGALPKKLRRLVVRSTSISREVVAALAAGPWPELEELVLWIGASDVTIGDLAPLLDGVAAPALVTLGICDTTRTNDVCRRLAKSPLASRLRKLDLSRGAMTDGGAAALGAAAAAFSKLESLDARGNFLGPLGEEYLRRVVPNALTGEQRARSGAHA